MESIRLRQLCFEYRQPGHPNRLVLDDINLVVEQGEVLCICGFSGHGKSTLLRTIAGLEKPLSGHIFFNGIESRNHNALKVSQIHHVAFMFQNSALISNLKVFENVALPIRYHHPERHEQDVQETVENLLESMLVAEYAEHYPYTLSVGIQRRVAIARAMALEPRILLLDEPTSGLDAKNRRSLLALIQNQRILHHATIIIVTHDVSITKELNGMICSLHNGQLSTPMTYENFLTSPETHIQELVLEIKREGHL